MSSLFGGSKSKSTSTSDNQAYGDIRNKFLPVTDYASSGADAISRLLGGDSTGFDNYKKATGFDFTQERGSRAITGKSYDTSGKCADLITSNRREGKIHEV